MGILMLDNISPHWNLFNISNSTQNYSNCVQYSSNFPTPSPELQLKTNHLGGDQPTMDPGVHYLCQAPQNNKSFPRHASTGVGDACAPRVTQSLVTERSAHYPTLSPIDWPITMKERAKPKDMITPSKTMSLR